MADHMEDDEYESLPDSAGPMVHMTAGSLAGVFEHCVMFPFDVVKTRLQRLAPSPEATYRGTTNAMVRMIRAEGYSSLYRGLPIVAGGAGPAHALYFGTYEQAKIFFGANSPTEHRHLATGAAAVTASLAHDLFMNPIDVVKQRLQVFGSPYRGVGDCFVQVYRQEGFRAFYRSLSTQVMMNIPFQCTHLVTYEFFRKTLNPSGAYHPPTHLVAGAVAGCVAAAATMPFDVAKTLLNTQEQCPGSRAARDTLAGRRYVRGLFAALSTIHRLSGPSGFFKGVSARILFTAPATAISWSVYEFFKHWLVVPREEPTTPSTHPTA
eukprot:m.111422 g.111422  ORF g.111422 m.111422 type:complete len:322 (+) comp16116_c1_seq2:374-1339(+)